MRKHRAFKDLTEQEIDQIAEWLRHDTYEVVLDRIRKPRPEGFGFARISRKPLELLYAKKNTVDRINQRISSGEKLGIVQLDAIIDGERPDLPEQIHDAILETTYEIVTSEENTPTRLLALQRLADFPERAELRARKEERQCDQHSWRREQHSWKSEQHSWKRELHGHKLEMDAHRKHITEERLTLAQRSFELREKSAGTGPGKKPSLRPGEYFDANGRLCDELGPIPKSLNNTEAIRHRVRTAFGTHKLFDQSPSTNPSSSPSSDSNSGGPESPSQPSSSECHDTPPLSQEQTPTPSSSVDADSSTGSAPEDAPLAADAPEARQASENTSSFSPREDREPTD